MRSLARSGDDGPKALFLGRAGELGRLHGGAVGGVDVDFVGYTVFLQLADGLFHHRQVAVATHDNANFFHNEPSSLMTVIPEGSGRSLRTLGLSV